MQTEKIPLALLYKQNGEINIEVTMDAYAYEVLGFLDCYVRREKKKLINLMEDK